MCAPCKTADELRRITSERRAELEISTIDQIKRDLWGKIEAASQRGNTITSLDVDYIEWLPTYEAMITLLEQQVVPTFRAQGYKVMVEKRAFHMSAGINCRWD